MGSLAITTIVCVIILWYDIRPKWKNGQKKIFWICTAFLAAGYVILAFAAFDIIATSPMKPLETLIQNVFDLQPTL